MKNSRSFLLPVFCFFIFSIIGCGKEKVIKENELPLTIRTKLETHFASCNIIKIVKDKEDNELSYDITLDCGINIEFNGQNQVIDIDGVSQLPNSVIPAGILNYTSLNYPNDFIRGWELEGANQRIDLNSDLVLEFDANSNFLRIVD